MSAADGNLSIALRIQADLDQARAQLKQLQVQIDQVGASATKASAGANATAAAIGEQTDAATSATAALGAQADAQAALGETEAQAAARIHAIVAASLEQADANGAQLASEQALTESIGQRAAATEEQVAAARAAAASGVQDRAVVGGQIADYAALDAIMGKKVATTEEAAAAEAALDRLQASGMISTEELADAFAALDVATAADTKATQANTAAQVENAAAKGINARTSYSLSALISDASTGQFSRSRREMAALANETGLMSKLLSPTGLAIGGTVAAIVALGAAAITGYEQEQRLNDALIATGNAADITAPQVLDMADSLTSGATTLGAAKEAMLLLVQSGRFAGDQLQKAGQATVDFAALTGQSMQSAANAVESLNKDPLRAVVALNDQYHFLSLSEYQWMQQLEKEGQGYKAAEVAMDAFGNAMHARAQTVASDLNYFGRVLQALKNEPSMVINGLESLGQKSTLQDQQASLRSYLETQQSRGAARFDIRAGHLGWVNTSGNATVQAAIDKYNALTAAIDQQVLSAKAASAAIKEQTSEVDAAAKMNAHVMAPYANHRSIDPRIAALQQFQQQIDGLSTHSFATGSHALDAYAQGIARLTAEMQKYIAKGGDATRAAALFDQGQKALQKTLDETRAQHMAAFVKQTQDMAAQLQGPVYVAAQRYIDQLAAAKKALADGEITQAAYNARVAVLAQIYDHTATKTQQSAHQIDQFTIKAARNIENELGTSMYDLLSGNFHGIAASWRQMVLKMIADAESAQLAKALFGSFGTSGQMGGLVGAALDWFTGNSGINIGSGNLSSAVSSDIGSMSLGMESISTGSASSVTPLSFPGFASGGISTHPQLAMVSEGAYPAEAHVPLPDGRSIPVSLSGALPQGGGGGNVIVQINNQSGATATASMAQGPKGEPMLKVLIQAVGNDIRAGGPTSQAISQTFSIARKGQSFG